MPRRPRRPCPKPGCPELLARGEKCPRQHGARRLPCRGWRCPRLVLPSGWNKGYCAQCLPRVDPRPSAARRGYGAAWRRVAKRHLAAHPLCSCGAPGVLVDHIVPVRDGGSNGRANRQTLCVTCHAAKTRADNAYP